MVEPKYKVGDRVRIISNANNCSKKPIGYIFIVAQVSKQINNYYREVYGSNMGVAEGSLMLVNNLDKLKKAKEECLR